MSSLLTNNVDVILSVRDKLFSEAQTAGLASDDDELVSRRAVKRGKPLNIKNAEGVWTLSSSLKNNSNVPRDVIKNGKRDRTYLEVFREASIRQNISPKDLLPFCLTLSNNGLIKHRYSSSKYK